MSGEPASGGSPPRRRPIRLILIVAILAAIALIILWPRGPEVPARAVVTVDLHREVPERIDSDLPGLFGAPRLDLVGLRRVLSRAAVDPRVKGILLRIGGAPIDFALAEELRAMVEAFRGSGKPAVAFLEGAGGTGYLVGAAADEVILSGSSDLGLVGLSVRGVFLGEALEKLGLELDLVRAGEYKGAFEELTAGEGSPAFRRALGETADSLYLSLVDWGLERGQARDLLGALLESRQPGESFPGVMEILMEGRRQRLAPEELVRRLLLHLPEAATMEELRRRSLR